MDSGENPMILNGTFGIDDHTTVRRVKTTIEEGSSVGKIVPNWIKNQPWNLNPMPSLEWHDFLHNIDPISRTILVAPGWAQGAGIGTGIAALGDTGGTGCGCK
jgi:hypothetical protein